MLAGLILFTVLFQIFGNREQVIRDAEIQVKNMSMITEEAVLASMKGIEIVLDELAYDVLTAHSIKAIKIENLNHHTKSIEKFKTAKMSLIDENGDPQWHSSDKGLLADSNANLADSDYFKTLKNAPTDFFSVTVPIFEKNQTQWVLIIAKRLSDKNGQFLGVATCSLSSDFFKGIQEKINAKGQTVFTVATGNPLRFLYRFPEEKELAGKAFTAPTEATSVINQKVHSEVFQAVSPVDQVKRIYTYSWISSYPILIVVGKDLNPILSAWQIQSLSSVGLIIFGIMMSIALSSYFLSSHRKFRKYQMQLANSAKFVALGEMSGSIAHEINNPLMIISGHIEKMRRRLSQGELNESKTEESLKKIENNVDRISKIVSGLRKFSNHSDLHLEKIALDTIIDEALALSAERFKSVGVTVQTDLKTTWVHVNINETQIMQVLINLLNNSFDEISKFQDRWVKIETSVEKNRVKIAVTDCGLGLSREIADRIMVPFFTTKGVGKGTGLGLSLSKEIIEAHGGNLRYDSTSPNTRFIIELPVVSENKQARTKRPAIAS